jgi:F0F1-type ATP synthase delta subunit
MKYNPKIYAISLFEALESASQENQDKIIKNFLKVVKKYGDSKKLKDILDEFTDLVVKKTGGKNIKVELARHVSDETMLKIKNSFNPKDFVNFIVNPSLIAGVRILVDGNKELDSTIVGKVKKILFKNK